MNKPVKTAEEDEERAASACGMKYKLRPYQQEASDAAVEFFESKEQYNALMVLATGAGKSLCIADIAYRLGGKVLILSPSKEILEQNYAKLKSYGVEDIAIYSASCNEKEISRITFATIGSIIRKKEKFDKFRAIIIDEAHVCNAKEGMYKEFLTHVRRKVLGLTATPYRLSSQQGKVVKGEFKPMPFRKGRQMYDKSIENRCIEKMLTRTVPKMFQKIIYQVPIQTLLEQGYLARLRYFPMPVVDTAKVKRNSTGQDFDDRSLMDEMIRCGYLDKVEEIVTRLLHPKSADNKRHGILVFTKFIDESEELCQRIPDSAMVSGETPKNEREQILEDFKTGKVKVLFNCSVLTTGFDYPALDTVVMARPTMSLAMWYQICGRAIRPYEGKNGWIIDLCGNIERFGEVENLQLVNDDKGLPAYIGYVGGEWKYLTGVYY
jgi:DNA repair protein RadD